MLKVKVYWYRRYPEEDQCNECDTPTDMRLNFKVTGDIKGTQQNYTEILPLCQPCHGKGKLTFYYF